METAVTIDIAAARMAADIELLRQRRKKNVTPAVRSITTATSSKAMGTALETGVRYELEPRIHAARIPALDGRGRISDV